MDAKIRKGEYVLFDVGERIFICSLKTIQKYPYSTLAKCINHSSSDEKGTTISLECDPKYFQMILDYMRDGRLDGMELLSYTELTQLLKEAKFFCLDSLIDSCERRLKDYPDDAKAWCVIVPQVVTNRQEFNKILEKTKDDGKLTVLLNIYLLAKNDVREMIALGSHDKFNVISCIESVTANSSELYEGGKLIKCSSSPVDLLSYVYYSRTGVML